MSRAPSHRILVVEDEIDLATGLRNNLELEGHEVLVAHDGLEGVRLALGSDPSLILLDLMLPGMDGLDVLRSIRREGLRCPILLLTARGAEADKVQGLRSGADDYVTKPFGLLELLARVEALLRRVDRAGASLRQGWTFGGTEVDGSARRVRQGDRELDLAPLELDLLLALLRRDGCAAPRAELLREVWGYGGGVRSRTVDTHVAELRRKLGEDGRHLETVRKVGYRLDGASVLTVP